MPCFRTILVAADFSERSKSAFRFACSLAEETKTRIFVLHVAEEPFSGGLLERMAPRKVTDRTKQNALEEWLREEYSPDRPIEVEYRIDAGIITDQILRLTHEAGADLIVLGTHGRSGVRRILAGSVAEAILHRAGCSVLALHTPGLDRPTDESIRVMLHPTDFSDRSDAALRVARLIARDHGARLLLLYVEPIDFVAGVALGAPLNPIGYHEPLMHLRAKVDGRDLKYPVEMQCEQGDPATQILRVAEQIRCDLIILGSHGRTALGRLLMGSVAEAVLRRSSCPSLIIKPTRVEPARASDTLAEKATVLT
ncbi:universal stress protein [Tundrisphaera lichenicola]|uniref:universal stress protein n=1 Tax=Tundrisphaera lichenicola TaxID=2029860 RepID=UPI003EBA1D62